MAFLKTDGEEIIDTPLLHGPIPQKLFHLTYPILLALGSLLLFNLVDTFFVGQLGTLELAALSFTFPISYLLLHLLMGLGVGISSLLAEAVGKKDLRRVKRVTRDGMHLLVFSALLFGFLGLMSAEGVFSLLGAGEDLMPLIIQYMSWWYGGLVFLAIPMAANAAIRASGDSKTASLILITSAVMNAILDPILIFGFFGVPRFGLQGAAMATVFSWMAAAVVSFWVLFFREKMVLWEIPRLRAVAVAWRRLLSLGIPAAGSNILVPLSSGLLTAMIAPFGSEAVAGFGVGSRVEPVAMVVVVALASALTPFVGQNWGAGRYDRVWSAIRHSWRFALCFEAFVFFHLFLLAPTIARVFSDNSQTRLVIEAFLGILPLSYGFQGVTILTCAALNAVQRPLYATWISAFRLLALYLPFAWVGSQVFGLRGIFLGAAIANIANGILAVALARKSLKGGYVNA